MQGEILDGWIALQVIAQALGHGQHPLAHRRTREDVVCQKRGGFHHAPGITGGTDAATLARIRDEEVARIGVVASLKESAPDRVGKDLLQSIYNEAGFDATKL